MLYFIAAGHKIDTDRTPRFGKQVDLVYQNPFTEEEKEKGPQTAAEIKQHILNRIREHRHGG